MAWRRIYKTTTSMALFSGCGCSVLILILVFLNSDNHCPFRPEFPYAFSLKLKMLAHLARIKYRGLEQTFQVSTSLVQDALERNIKFCQLELDEAARDFLEECRRNRPGFRLRQYDSFYEAQAGMYRLHLISLDQAKSVLKAAGYGKERFDSSLDIGAGEGKIAEDVLRHISNATFTTETSRKYADILRQKGIPCLEKDLCEENLNLDSEWQSFDLVALFNVLDRTPDPEMLLTKSLERLRPNGTLLISTPLPFRPVYYQGIGPIPKDSVGKLAEEARTKLSETEIKLNAELWEENARWFMFEVIPRYGLELQAFSKMPYIVSGDLTKEFTFHENIVLVSKKHKHN